MDLHNAAKAAINNLTKSLSKAYAKYAFHIEHPLADRDMYLWLPQSSLLQ